jgi:hypothetical protein
MSAVPGAARSPAGGTTGSVSDTAAGRSRPGARSPLRSVTVPAEHGGWGLTLEPVVLGLLVAPGIAGACLGLAAFVAFLARTPFKVLLVDARRGRTLARTRLARRVLVAEGALLLVLAAVAAATAHGGFWWPVVPVVPLVGLELWFDMRSRSRRLAPELAGAVGIAGVGAMIALAGGTTTAVALACWLLVGARAVTGIVTVRDQVGRLHGRVGHPGWIGAADVVALAAVAAAVVVEPAALAGAVAVLGLVVAQRLLGRRPTPRAVVLGLRQSGLGLTVVLVAALGLLAA